MILIIPILVKTLYLKIIFRVGILIKSIAFFSSFTFDSISKCYFKPTVKITNNIWMISLRKKSHLSQYFFNLFLLIRLSFYISYCYFFNSISVLINFRNRLFLKKYLINLRKPSLS